MLIFFKLNALNDIAKDEPFIIFKSTKNSLD